MPHNEDSQSPSSPSALLSAPRLSLRQKLRMHLVQRRLGKDAAQVYTLRDESGVAVELEVMLVCPEDVDILKHLDALDEIEDEVEKRLPELERRFASIRETVALIKESLDSEAVPA